MLNSGSASLTPSSAASYFGERGINAGDSGGTRSNNTIDYITIASTGNAIDFGDLSTSRAGVSALSDGTYGVFAGGESVNVIDYVTIATLANAQDFGNLSANRQGIGACSGD